MTEAAFTIQPTVIVRLDEQEGTLGVVTIGEGEEQALIVFRGPEDARKYQEQAGKHAAEEGFKLIGMDEEALAALLETQGIGQVAMLGPWVGGDAPVDLFSTANFLRLLEEAART